MKIQSFFSSLYGFLTYRQRHSTDRAIGMRWGDGDTKYQVFHTHTHTKDSVLYRLSPSSLFMWRSPYIKVIKVNLTATIQQLSPCVCFVCAPTILFPQHSTSLFAHNLIINVFFSKVLNILAYTPILLLPNCHKCPKCVETSVSIFCISCFITLYKKICSCKSKNHIPLKACEAWSFKINIYIYNQHCFFLFVSMRPKLSKDPNANLLFAIEQMKNITNIKLFILSPTVWA